MLQGLCRTDTSAIHAHHSVGGVCGRAWATAPTDISAQNHNTFVLENEIMPFG